LVDLEVSSLNVCDTFVLFVEYLSKGHSKHVYFFNHLVPGLGESYDKRASIQMAALDILLKMKACQNHMLVVPFGVVPGWRISPRVCDDLYKFCASNGLQEPRFVTKSNTKNKDTPFFGIECFIGSKRMSSKTAQQVNLRVIQLTYCF